jgi:hypothetical protein
LGGFKLPGVDKRLTVVSAEGLAICSLVNIGSRARVFGKNNALAIDWGNRQENRSLYQTHANIARLLLQTYGA